NNSALRSPDTPTEVRNSWFEGAGEAGGSPPAPDDPALGRWGIGRAKGAFADGTIDDADLEFLDKYVSGAPPDELNRYAKAIFHSGVGPSELLPSLADAANDTRAGLFSALVALYAREDPVAVSEAIAGIQVVPDEAV